MFIWLNKQGVKSDRGFVVQFTGRFTAEYRDAGKVVKLYVESGHDRENRPCIIVDPGAFQRWDGHGGVITAAEQTKMFQNLREALKFQGLELVVESGEEPDWRGVRPWR